MQADKQKLDPKRELSDAEKVEVPTDVEDRLRRGRDRLRKDAALRDECLEFWRGNQYVYQNAQGNLAQLPVNDPNKPHRIRQTRNLLIDVVGQEVSSATQRVPAYEVNPATTDPEDIGAARLAEKLASYGYDKWNIRDVTTRVVTYAVVADEGFAWPYFDTTVGDRIEGDLHTGEIKIRVLGPNEVFWEPGVRFEDSRWYAVQQARALDEVYGMPGFVGGKLTADASTRSIVNSQRTATAGGKLVLVTEYLERPSAKYPQGRRVFIANGRQVAKVEAYPCVDAKGNVLDEPVLHKLAYFTDPDNDRDFGLVRHLLDAQRTFNDATNKTLEWKNLALLPQILVPAGSRVSPITDEPGLIIEFEAVGGQAPQWRPVPTIPGELFQLRSDSQMDIAGIAAQNQVPSQVESGKGIAALLEKDANRRYSFIASLAEFHSRLMRHCLSLAQRHYSEPRLLTVRGRFGTEVIADFQGASIRGQVDVVVLPGSIEPRTRAAIEQRIMNYAQLGWISPQAAMAAINSGTASQLVEDYELDVTRANLVIRKIRAIGAGSTEVPTPRKVDNIAIHKSVVASWMKTSEFDTSPADVQQAAEIYYDALEQLEAEEQAKKAAQQAEQAQGLGMANAARPAQTPPLPSIPGLES